MSAGSAIERDIGKENDQPEDQTYFGSLRKKDEDAYQKVDQLVPADHPVNVAGTMRQLHNETQLIPGAEPISRNFISPKVSKWKRDMDATIEQNAEKGRPYPVTDKLPADALPPATSGASGFTPLPPSVSPTPAAPRRPSVATRPTQPAQPAQPAQPTGLSAPAPPPIQSTSAAPPQAAPVPPPTPVGLGGLGITPHPIAGGPLIPEQVRRPAAWDQPVNSQPLTPRDASAFSSMGVRTPPEVGGRNLAPDPAISRPPEWDEPPAAAPLTPSDSQAFASMGVKTPPVLKGRGLEPDPNVSRPAAWDQPASPEPLDWRDKKAFAKSAGVAFPRPEPLLPYSAARALKSQMGRKIDWTGNAKDRELNKSMINVWGNLRADIDHAAGQLSPEAKQAVQDANRTFQQNEATRKELARYINKTGGPESIFKAVTSGMKDGSTHLDRVLPALKPETQDLVRSTVLDRLGRPSAGSDAPFNPHTFLNNWNKQLSREAKDSLFGESGPSNDLRNSLDRLTKTIGNVKKGTELLNPSGSGEVVTKAAGVEAAWDAIKQLLMGKVFGAATLGLGVAANRGVAKWLANPKTVDWLNSATKAPTSAIPNLVNQLGKIDDPDARSLHDYLTQQQPQARASGGRTGPTDDELVERLMKRYRAAKRAEDASTKPLLEQPDAAIIHALKISGSRL
jgi:hypothetical protein